MCRVSCTSCRSARVSRRLASICAANRPGPDPPSVRGRVACRNGGGIVTTIELAWGPVQQEMAGVLAVEPPDIATILHQLTQLQDILERIPPDFGENPVADFNRLYRTITASIGCRLRAGDFADPVFLELLDVEFEKRYLVALRLWSDPTAETPWAWSVLFRRLRDRTVRALPSAA